MDTNLRMETNVRKLLAKARPKTTAVLRSRRFYSTHGMITQFKVHVLCLLEVNPGGFYHATDTILEQLEYLADNYIKQLR